MNQPPLYGQRMGSEVIMVRSLFFGIFHDPNDLAQILATSIPFAFALVKGRLPNVLLGGAVSLMLIKALGFTDSRGGQIGLAVAVVMTMALILPARWSPAVLVAIAVGAMLLMPLAGGYLDASAHDRVVFWGDANRVFKANPVFGVGYGMFSEYVPGSRAAHNAFVLCYTELGFFGYWFWYCLIHLSFVSAWRTREVMKSAAADDQRWLRTFSGLCMVAMSAFLASAYFLSRAFVYPLYFLIAMMGALPYVAEQYLPKDHPPLINVTKDVLIMGSVGALVSIAYIYGSILILNKVWGG